MKRNVSNPTAGQPMARAFTLIELMISIAIVLILMLGINYVFSQSAATIAMGHALGNVTRDHRNARPVIEDDFRNMMSPAKAPFLLIHNEAIAAFADVRDLGGDNDTDPLTWDLDGLDPEEAVPVTNVNRRVHRSDRLSFFTERATPYTRQTGGTGSYVSSESNTRAWVWYGHLRLHNNLQAPKSPGDSASDNHNNRFAGQWALGRVAMLIGDTADGDDIEGAGTLEPLAFGTPTQIAPFQIQQSRLDRLVVPSLSDYRAALPDAAGWWTPVNPDAPGTPSVNYAFEASNLPIRTSAVAATSAELARATPIFMPGCAQFIVEFAGDYYTQSANEPAGTIDYDQDAAGVQRIHWYGMPRDLNGDGAFDVNLASVVPAPIGGFAPVERAPLTFEQVAAPALVFAWGQDEFDAGLLPRLIRLTINVTDANSRLADGQVLEYVMELPRE